MRVRLLSVLAAIALFVSAFSWFIPTQQASAAPSLKSVSASGTVIGGGTIQVKVVLTEKAPSGGTTVSLKSNRPSIVPVPASIKVPAGQTTAYANGIVTKGTRTSVIVTITGTLNGSTDTFDTLIRAPYVADVYGSKSVGPGANTVNIRIAAKAGVGGMLINLKSSRPSSVSVPDTIKVPEGETTIVLPYTIATASKQYTFSITAEAFDKGADVVPAEKVVKPIQFFITYYPAVSPTPTRTATSTKTATSTVAPATATNTAVPTSTNTVAAPTMTATTAPATATSSVPTATFVPWACGSYVNAPGADQTNTGFTSTSDMLDTGAVLRVTNTSGAPFDITFFKHDFSAPQSFLNQTVWVFTITTGYDWYQFRAQTNPAVNVDWDVSCTVGGSNPATNTPAAPTSTATIAPPTATNTAVATATAGASLSYTCLNVFNDPQYDRSTSYFNMSGILSVGDVVHISTTNGTTFDAAVQIGSGSQTWTYGVTRFDYAITAINTWHGFVATTNPSSTQGWTISCDGTMPTQPTNTPVLPTSTAAATNTSTNVPATATATATTASGSSLFLVSNVYYPDYQEQHVRISGTGFALNSAMVVEFTTAQGYTDPALVWTSSDGSLPPIDRSLYCGAMDGATTLLVSATYNSIVAELEVPILCVDPTPTPTYVPPTEEPTSTPAPTSTTAIVYSYGCTALRNGDVNYYSSGPSVGNYYFFAGETLTFSGSGATFNIGIYGPMPAVTANSQTSYTFVVPTTGSYSIGTETLDWSSTQWIWNCS